jgi:hypothetical protein
MDQERAKELITRNFKGSTCQEYTKTLKRTLESLKSKDVYDIYRRLEDLEKQFESQSDSYKKKVFSTFKSIAERMSEEERKNLPEDSIKRLQILSKKSKEVAPKPREDEELDSEVSDLDSNDEFEIANYSPEKNEKYQMEQRIKCLEKTVEELKNMLQAQDKTIKIQDIKLNSILKHMPLSECHRELMFIL